jgi:hypothetical protein
MDLNRTMNLSRGALHFHRLFSLRQLAIGNCEPFIGRIIRKFLEIGEAVASRWIEMPRGILVFQTIPGRPDSGAIYLYDRQQEVFYLIWFDGPDDNLTLEESNQLISEYRLLQYVEQPSLIHSEVRTVHNMADSATEAETTQPTPRFIAHTTSWPPVVGSRLQIPDFTFQMASPGTRRVWFQSIGTA